MDSKLDSFANRLDLAMKKNNINQVELSNKTKIYEKYISQSLINKYLKGKAFARQDNIYILSKILDVNEACLMGFDVPIKRMSDEEKQNCLNNSLLNLNGLDETDIKNINEYIKMYKLAKKAKKGN